MTPKQAEKVRTLRAKIEAGLPVKDSEWPAWIKACGPKSNLWKPADDDRSYQQFRAEYETSMRTTHGQDWEPNPAAVEWEAFYGHERGIRCNTCGRLGVEWCQSCRNWLERISDRKRIRRIITPQVAVA